MIMSLPQQRNLQNIGKLKNIVKRIGSKTTKSKLNPEEAKKSIKVSASHESEFMSSTINYSPSFVTKSNRELITELYAATDLLPYTPHTQEYPVTKESPVMSEVTCSVFGNQVSNFRSRGNISVSSSNKISACVNDSASSGNKSDDDGNINPSYENKNIDPYLVLVRGQSNVSNTASSQTSRNLCVDGSHSSVINIVEGDESDAVELLRQQVPKQVSQEEVIIRTEEIPLSKKTSTKSRKKLGRMFRR